MVELSEEVGTLSASQLWPKRRCKRACETLDEVARLMAKSVTAQKALDVNTKIATDPLSDIKEEEQVQELEGPPGLVFVEYQQILFSKRWSIWRTL